MTNTPQNELLQTNPLLQNSTLPHGAFPFDQLKKEHYIPALEEAIRRAKVNLDKIRTSTDTPTFENTILALECASEDVARVSTVFFNLLSSNSDDELQAMAREISPRLAEFSSDITLDPKIFARVKAVWDGREQLGLTHENFRLAEKTYKDFARNGGLLDDQAKEKLRALDQEMSKLGPEYSDNVLKATNEFKLWIDKETDLDGLPESTIEAAAQAAKEAGREGQWLFTLHAPSLMPFMTYSSRSELREKMWRAANSKAYRSQHDNEPLTRKIASLRHQRANLLGYPTHAAFVLEERMAEKPEKVTAFLERILEKSKPAALRDVEAVRQLKKQTTGDGDLQSWDYAYWSEKLKMQLHNLDQEQLRPYFKLENVIEGVFEHARRLFGLKFTEAKGIPVYHPDVKTYEVKDEESGRFIGLFYSDFFPRESKRGGAWMTSFREQGFQCGKVERPHVSIVCNFTKPTPTKPSLLTFDEVRTLFHEFGHALHGLLSDCTYVTLAGTNVFWDFVELPSQIMENWALEKEALDIFAFHYETGEKLPQELTEKIRAAANFQAGYMAVRQIQFGLLDMAWHSQDPSQITDVDAFEAKVTERTRILPKVSGTNMSCSFSHIFAGGYSAGYYSYKWAEVLDADAFELFKERGLFNADVARAFRDNILSKGGTLHPMELYKKFRGREPDPDALLRRDGLIDYASDAGTKTASP
jgi:peptidyl-dipeptidase Dcp